MKQFLQQLRTNRSSAMESGYYSNEESPKGHKSRRYLKHYLGIFMIALISILAFLGCSTTQPMTKKVDNQASVVGDVKNFQYYVSRNIILTKTEDPEIVGKVAVSGQVKITSTKEIIQITSSTMGELLKTENDRKGNTIYYVAFETGNDNCLRFVQRKAGGEEKVYLDYDDVKNRAVNYGNTIYIVEWKGVEGLKQKKTKAKMDNFFGKMKGSMQGVTSDDKDDPYLLVKMKTKFKEKANYRKASGRKVEVK